MRILSIKLTACRNKLFPSLVILIFVLCTFFLMVVGQRYWLLDGKSLQKFFEPYVLFTSLQRLCINDYNHHYAYNRGGRNKSKMKEIMDGAQNGIVRNLELKAEGHDNVPVTTAKETCGHQFKKGISPIAREHTPFKRPRIIDEMYSLPCKKSCTKIMGSPAGHRFDAQSDNLTGDPGATVSADSEEAPSPLVLDENEDLDDSLLELEEIEVEEEDQITGNLTSEEIDKILQESDDDVIDNSDSLRLGDVSGKDDNTLYEHKSSDNILLSLSPPNASQLPKSYLVIDELETNYLGDVLSTNDTVLKVEEEINQSLKSEQLNQNSLNENAEIEKSEQPYYLSVDECAMIKPGEGSSDEETAKRDHTARGSEADAGTQMHMTSSEGDTLTREQDVSEEKADDGRVKEHISIPGSGEDEDHDLKGSSKNEQAVVESAQEKRPQESKSVKAVRTRPESRLNVEIERQKHIYLQHVSNHLDESYQNQGPMQELLSLVDEVADRNYYSFQQHPSDLTTRNYMNRHKSRPKIALFDWVKKNSIVPRFRGIADSLQCDPLP